MKAKFNICIMTVLVMVAVSCKKSWLDAKSDKSLVVPSSIDDLQAILDNDQVMNGNPNNGDGATPALGELSSDNFYLQYSVYTTRTQLEQKAYIWDKDIYPNLALKDWNLVYKSILYANAALDGLDKINPKDNQEAFNNVRGSALFYRAIGHYNIAQLFAMPYNASTAASDLGIPLRMTASTGVPSARATIKTTYDQIISDLKTAAELLPLQPLNKARPGKPAANALLSRVYLTMGDYTSALKYADATLVDYSTLMDYNAINGALSFPFPLFNQETIFYSTIASYTIINPPRCKIDLDLYNSYQPNDLRKSLFFKTETDGTYTFRGHYYGAAVHFGGLVTDEIYLNRAECLARTNNYVDAMNTLNTLLKTRWKTGTFVPFVAANATDALVLILQERRKELIFRGLRWTDLRRLNKEAAFAKVLKRNLNGVDYALEPNSARYTFAIPDEVINITGMPQNQR